MEYTSHFLKIVLVALGCFFLQRLQAQAMPTATQPIRLSAFAGLTGTYTGLASGRNLGITAGVDIGSHSLFSLRPSIEIRGTYPIDKGGTDNQRNILAGLKLAKAYDRLLPYGDVLFGRGQINYPNGYPNPLQNFLYFQSFSNVLSFGAGIDVPLSEHLQLKADAQVQRYSSPVADSGRLYSKPFTLGIVYRLASAHVRAGR